MAINVSSTENGVMTFTAPDPRTGSIIVIATHDGTSLRYLLEKNTPALPIAAEKAIIAVESMYGLSVAKAATASAVAKKAVESRKQNDEVAKAHAAATARAELEKVMVATRAAMQADIDGLTAALADANAALANANAALAAATDEIASLKKALADKGSRRAA